MKMATARIVAGVVATFYFHRCQTREEERDGKWINRKNKFAARKEAAINDGFTVTKLPGLLPRLQHHTSTKQQ